MGTIQISKRCKVMFLSSKKKFIMILPDIMIYFDDPKYHLAWISWLFWYIEIEVARKLNLDDDEL